MRLTCLKNSIEIQAGLINHLPSLKGRLAIITDDTVAHLYGKSLAMRLGAPLFSFPAGEKSKTRATKEHLENQLFEQGFGRDTCIIALGGGVVTDLAGFLAATYCRGIPYVSIPTTLLGMVDASIGGKTGVNVPYGKNLVGAIHRPQKVLIDPSLLQTLPDREFKQGIVEMIKHGLIAKSSLFYNLHKHADDLLQKDPSLLETMIFESCQIKKEIVEEDEKEQGKRRLLNFGHTVGHALESVTNYSLPHGEAVALGLLAESHLSLSLGALSQSDFDHIQNTLAHFALPIPLPTPPSLQHLLDAMAIDKKSLKGSPRFVILEKIGSSLPFDGHYCTPVDESTLKHSLEWMLTLSSNSLVFWAQEC